MQSTVGVVRSASLRNAIGVIVRAIQRLHALEIADCINSKDVIDTKRNISSLADCDMIKTVPHFQKSGASTPDAQRVSHCGRVIKKVERMNVFNYIVMITDLMLSAYHSY